MGPPSYMRSVVDRNVVMRRIPVKHIKKKRPSSVGCLKEKLVVASQAPNVNQYEHFKRTFCRLMQNFTLISTVLRKHY
jgi:hypothetical protein